MLLLPACATRKQTTESKVQETKTTDTRVNSTLTDITIAKPKEIKLKVEADSSEAVFQLPKGTKVKPLANVKGRRSEVASVQVDTAGILRVSCKCREEELQQTIYELERTITGLRDSVSKDSEQRSEVSNRTQVVEKKDGPLEWLQKRIGGLVILIGILLALAIGLKFWIKGRP